MNDGRLDRAEAGRPDADTRPVREQALLTRRVGRYRCRLVSDLPDDELRGLIAVLQGAPPARRVAASSRVLGGRAVILRFLLPSVGEVVIKEYRRGGMLRFVRRRYYVRNGTPRPERELNSLLAVRADGVNAPDPIACFSRGVVLYRGWLVTRFIKGRGLVEVCTADTAAADRLVDELVHQVRVLVRHRIAHIDLHPGNVYVGDDGRVYLLDFDRATLFDGTEEALRQRYDVRWRRAVEKHALPPVLAERFTRALLD
jgi:tRNA A-37 threonylcarbamoyl transferase component Bud32